MKKDLCFVCLLLAVVLMLAGCSGNKEENTTEPAVTEEVFMPTRSVATLTVPTKAATCNDVMVFVQDLNYADGAVVHSGETFLKEWEVQNLGDCEWDENYHLYFISGDQMGAQDFLSIPKIPVGAKGTVSVQFKAPAEPGEYRSEWKIFNKENRFFGESLYVEVTVQ